MTNITFEGKWEGSKSVFRCEHGLIQALLVFYKYNTRFNITEKDGNLIVDIKPSTISDEDTAYLAERGFFAQEYNFQSDDRWQTTWA